MAARGMIANAAGTLCVVVVDNTAYEVKPNGDRASIGTLLTSRGAVGMKMGLTQLVIVDGSFGYVYDFQTKAFTRITSDGWLGSFTVDYLDGYFVFIDPNSQTWYTSANEDALTISALDTAAATANPDKLVGQIVTNRMLVLFGETGAEIWQDTAEPPPGVPFSRNNGAHIDVGLLARHTAKELDNSAFWLGRDTRGAGIVYRLDGFRAARISTMAIEQKIQKAIFDGEDVSQSVAYTYQQDGHSFYVLQVPGLETTWVFDVASGHWHERAELVNGDYAQHRGRYHAYCYGKHLIVGDDEVIYAYDPDVNTNAGDVLVRDRVSPHMATPSLDRLTFPVFELDCTVGFGVAEQAEARVLMRYSNDGGTSWESWRTATLGAVGQRQARARFLRCGSARDRVWQVRCTDDTQFAIVAAHIEAA